ncbi:MarR family winged helix-turn-helix transcriptional regulator [Bradyrhizobium septentrionale]|uniref:Winged helix-turn-helix transcriptional regulator n=1 Tax=Bradyrhizobium septentrionale TaxID=1404411 RepID=A0A973W405_9BRAD|nr:MarR family winged helix-turn-helix transcriptional regulator [Bradyrhizobium septentrionale]UGY15593.1 MarR family winged helix-turn-helix transcriptional regulator [Bradyrhizobium septentrionale]UGY24169.1 MarR family winged helix-turn-helix transcriptional regulator [Bradyrhizobium septentrionale]
MPSRRSVQNTHNRETIRALHESLIDIMRVLNRPQGDERMVREAGIPLERALFPLLVIIERRGPIGVVDLADGVGRDHTTVSRQIAKLESLGLVGRQAGAADRRVREVIVTPKGKAMTDAVDAARERFGEIIFKEWSERDVQELVRLMRKFADSISGAALDDPAPHLQSTDERRGQG